MTVRIRVQSSALGYPTTVNVVIYPTLEEMRAAAGRHSPTEDFTRALGVTHCTTVTHLDDQGDTTRVQARPIVRLAKSHLGMEVLAHEMHHATTALYGAHLPPGTRVEAVLHGGNEPFAYLHGQLLRRLVDRLYALGFYTQEGR